jgi:Leucine-rich repeat (LRR) protein
MNSYDVDGILPAYVDMLTNLRILHIQDDERRDLPSVVTNRGIDSIIDWVHRVNDSKKTKVLNLSGLAIRDCPFAPYKPLIILDLSRNRIETINEEVLVLATLTEMNLSSNRIRVIPDEIFRLFKCSKINLTQNRITRIPENVGKMSSLTALNISANRVEEIHPGVSDCTTLKDLRLSGNCIRMLPLEMHVMSQLAVLHLKDNDFGPTMFEVIDTFSITNLLDFLKQLAESRETQVSGVERGQVAVECVL